MSSILSFPRRVGDSGTKRTGRAGQTTQEQGLARCATLHKREPASAPRPWISVLADPQIALPIFFASLYALFLLSVWVNPPMGGLWFLNAAHIKDDHNSTSRKEDKNRPPVTIDSAWHITKLNRGRQADRWMALSACLPSPFQFGPTQFISLISINTNNKKIKSTNS